MKAFLAVIILFTVVTAYSQSSFGNDSMESQIRQRLAIQPDRDVFTLRSDKQNEIRRGDRTYSGILVQLVKTDNPLQLINPAAPAEYGAARDNLIVDSQNGKEGLKLFSIGF